MPVDQPQDPQAVDDFLLRRLSQETEARAASATAPESTAAGASAELLAALDEAVDRLGPALVAASHDLAAHPEESFEEHRSAAALADLVEEHDVEVVRGAHGLATGLRAEVGPADGPTIAVLSEYDALPGIGHGCGHNVIATAGVGAFPPEDYPALGAITEQLSTYELQRGGPNIVTDGEGSGAVDN